MDYSKAISYSKIPGPSALQLILSNLPGGKLFGKDVKEMVHILREEYGDVFKLPGVFGNVDMVFSQNPDHFETVYRTEGPWPRRVILETVRYYRENVRQDIYEENPGLLNSQEKKWGDFRTAVNPIMMQPKTTKLYIPLVDEIVDDFLARVRFIRDPNTNQLPDNFESELNNWALETIGVIGLDTRLGLISDNHDAKSKLFIDSLKRFFQLIFELEFKPSMWRYYKTPALKELINILDTITNLCSDYVDEAKAKMDKRLTNSAQDHEQSVLEKLLKVDSQIAKVMVIDMIFAGVDTTSATIITCLYLLAKNPEKQERLRQELLTILPEKNSRLTVEKMAHLPYLRACIKESFRMLPVFNGTIRDVGQNLVVGGYQIPKGTTMIMSSTLLQSDERVFEKPNEFRPERWIKNRRGSAVADGADKCPANSKSIHPFAYLPFGFGPRMCIGKRFAEMEVEIFLSKLIRNFNVEWEHPDLKFIWTTIITPGGKLKFTLRDLD